MLMECIEIHLAQLLDSYNIHTLNNWYTLHWFCDNFVLSAGNLLAHNVSWDKLDRKYRWTIHLLVPLLPWKRKTLLKETCDAVGVQMCPVKDVTPEPSHSSRPVINIRHFDMYNSMTTGQCCHIKIMSYNPKQLLNVLMVRHCPWMEK